MKFRTTRATLLRPLRVVTGVVDRRHTLPVLANLHVEAGAEGLILRGTDLNVEIVARVTEGVTVEAPGTTTVPAHKLSEICQSLPEAAEVAMALEGERAVLRSGRSRFALATIPAGDFPTENQLIDQGDNQEPAKEGVSVSLAHASLRRLLDRTKFAMGVQDVRYYLNGLLLEVTAESLRAAASDGFRMALCTLTEGGVADVDRRRLIVPRKSVQDLERLVADSDEDIALECGENTLRATQGSYTLTTKLVDGQYPEVDRLVPRNTVHTVTADRDTLRGALYRTAILSNEKSQDVRLQLNGEQMTIRASNPEQEEAEETVAVEFDGAEVEIGFNVRYLQDVLSALETERVKMSMPAENNIALVEGPGDDEALYIVMPLRR